MDLLNAMTGAIPPHLLDAEFLTNALWLAASLCIFGFSGMALTMRRQRPASRYTPAELAARQQAARLHKEEIARLRKIKRVGQDLKKKIVAQLANAGFAYIYERKGVVARASKPHISHVLYGSDAIWFHIDKLPFRIQFTDLLDPKVGENLSLAIGRECKFISDTQLGLWVQVGLKSGVSAVPSYFAWHDKDNPQNAVDMLPKTKSFTVAFGLGENRKFFADDIRRFPHLLVAGATGGGKSVFLNQLLCTLIKNNTPRDLQLILIDLKGGLEFDAYESIPHLQRPMIDQPQNIPPALASVLAEKERRFTMLKKAHVKNIKAWNAASPIKLPYWFIIFDEIAALMLEPKLKTEVEQLVSNLAEQGRAVGIHLILCTQYPNKEVITTRIKANIPFKVAFASDDNGSMLVVGNLQAARLGARDGRMVFVTGLDRYELQAPFITEEQIAGVIAGTVEQPAAGAAVTPEEMFQLSVEAFEGSFAIKKIYEAFDGRAPQRLIEQTSKTFAYDFNQQGPVITLPAGRFILAPPENKRLPRRLFSVNGVLPSSIEEIYGPGSIVHSATNVCSGIARPENGDDGPEKDDCNLYLVSTDSGGTGGRVQEDLEIFVDDPENEDQSTEDGENEIYINQGVYDSSSSGNGSRGSGRDWSWDWGDQ
jgi:hypothetical protein